MKLRRIIILTGVVPLLFGVVFLAVTALSSASSNVTPALKVTSVISALSFAVAGVALLALTQQPVWFRLLARGAATVLGLLAVSELTIILFGAGYIPLNNAPATVDRVANLFGSESDLLISTGLLCAAFALIALTLSGRRRAGAALGAALAVTVGLIGLGAAACSLLGLQVNRTLLSDTSLASVLFPVIAIGLFCAAKTEAKQLPATSTGSSLDHKLSVATGICLGLIALAGLLIFSLTGREAEDYQHLNEVDRMRDELDAAAAALNVFKNRPSHSPDSNQEVDLASFGRAVDEFQEVLRQFDQNPIWSNPQHPVSALLDRSRADVAQLQATPDLRHERRTKAPPRFASTVDVAATSTKLVSDISGLDAAIRADLVERTQQRAIRRRNTAIALSAAAAAIVALLGAVHLLFHRDSVARQRSEAALRRHNETLKNFAHTIAHDLRAPLRGIAGYATELDRQALYLDARSRHCVNQINLAAQNLERLIGDTLDYAQLDAETPQMTTVVLPTLVASLLQQRAPAIRQYGTQVDTHFGTVTVTSWERGLVQIIGNLLDNAIKYSRHAKPPRLRIETAQTPLSWRIVIYDNGVGFDMKYHDRIFGLFQRLVTTEEFEGTGAGLAIVRKITDRLGGSVCAEGRPGGGATFLVELPRIVNSEVG